MWERKTSNVQSGSAWMERETSMVPTTPVELSLYAGFAPGGSGGRDAWHAAWNAEQRNHTKAIALLAAAAESAPTEDRLVELGDEQRRGGRPEGARDTYARVLARGPSARASSGMGWALLRLGEPANAVAFFERAVADHRASEPKAPRRGTIDALRGLGAAHGALGACAEVAAVAKRLFEEAPDAAPLDGPPCPRVSP